MRGGRLGAAALLFTCAAAAPAMTVAEFLARAEALRAKGLLATLSSDAKLLEAEIKAVGPAWRAQAPAARPPVCVPAGRIAMKDDEIGAILKAVPAADRTRVSVRDAFIGALNTRYRCR